VTLATVALDAALTVVLEVGFFVLIGWRDGRFLAACALVNAATNLTLHLALMVTPPAWWWPGVAGIDAGAVVV
jgi:hypothetical protein